MKPSAIRQQFRNMASWIMLKSHISPPAQNLSSRPCTSSFSFRYRSLKTPPSRTMLCASHGTQQRLSASAGLPCSELRHILRPSKIQTFSTIMGEALKRLAEKKKMKKPRFSRTRGKYLHAGHVGDDGSPRRPALRRPQRRQLRQKLQRRRRRRYVYGILQ